MSKAGPILQAAYENSPPSSLLPKWHLARATRLVVDEEGSQTLASVVKCVNWYNKSKRPQHYHGWWPTLNFIAQRSRRFKTIIKGFVDKKYTVFWCVKSNAIARLDEKEIRQEFPKLKVVRILSKAQHLIERLEGIGIKDFKLVYDEPKSPYAIWTVNVGQTLQNLLNALNARGFEGLDHRDLWEQEYVDYDTPPMPKGVNVVIYTNTRFTVSLLPHRKPWWDRLGLSTGTKSIEKNGKDFEVGVGPQNIIAIFADPDAREFDEMRLVHPDNVEALKAARKRVTKRQRSYEEPMWYLAKGYTQAESERLGKLAAMRRQHAESTRVHHIIEKGGQHYELRPEPMFFTLGLRRGYPMKDGRAPKCLVLTSNTPISRDAYRAMSMLSHAVWLYVSHPAVIIDEPDTSLNYHMDSATAHQLIAARHKRKDEKAREQFKRIFDSFPGEPPF